MYADCGVISIFICLSKSKSEKLDALQTRLGLDETSAETPEPEKETVTYERRKAAKRKPYAEQFENLPVMETVEILPDEVLANPELYERIETAEETFEVRITPPRLWKRKYIRPKFRHKSDRSLPRPGSIDRHARL